MSKPFIIPIFLPHAGCPHRCVFCNQTAITGNNEPFPSAEGLRGEIDRLMPYKGKNRGKTEISFSGEIFWACRRKKSGCVWMLRQHMQTRR